MDVRDQITEYIVQTFGGIWMQWFVRHAFGMGKRARLKPEASIMALNSGSASSQCAGLARLYSIRVQSIQNTKCSSFGSDGI